MIHAPNDTLYSARKWREFSAADMTAGLDLVAIGGGAARWIVMKESGTLYARDRSDTASYLTGLPAGYVHSGQTSAIESTQTAAIIVYW